MDDSHALPGRSADATSSALSGPFGLDNDLYLICGEWADSNGSTYFVERRSRVDRRDVTTERPNRFEIYTFTLIRREGRDVHRGTPYVLDKNDDGETPLSPKGAPPWRTTMQPPRRCRRMWVSLRAFTLVFRLHAKGLPEELSPCVGQRFRCAGSGTSASRS